MIKKIVVLVLCITYAYAVPRTYIRSIVNKNQRVLYEVLLPREEYVAHLFPGESIDLGHWMELKKNSPIYIAVLKGDGEPMYIELGEEASGTCASETELPHSIVMYSGQHRPPSNQKHYIKYCGSGVDSIDFDFVITPDGKPSIVAREGVEYVREF
jgi:hypothetical protein